jgi:hypothetical protein
VFDINEKERIRYHMGYLNVQPASSISFGIPIPIQTLFLLEFAMDQILPEAEDRVRKLLVILDNIECRMIEGQQYLVVNAVDDIKIRADQLDRLEDEYSRWAARMADELGAPLYPGAYKFRRVFQMQGAGSIPVKNG